MDSEIIMKVNDIIDDINNSYEANRMIPLKKELLDNKDLLNDINNIKEHVYDKEYVDKKRDILDNSTYKEFKELEKEFYYFTKEVSKILSSLTKVEV